MVGSGNFLERVFGNYVELTGDAARAAVQEMLRRKVNCPLTSSCGRLFDAVAATLGLCARTTYEGQAAIRLEDAARRATDVEAPTAAALRGKDAQRTSCWPWEPVRRGELWELDSAALFAQTVTAQQRGLPTGEIAARFHLSLAHGLADLAAQAAREHGVNLVGLSGGVMQNALLARLLPLTLRARGLTLAVAESCTGGLLSKRITDVPGCSVYYLGGVCSYANEVKTRLLGVRKETLDTVGAVSPEVAEQMAAGVAQALGADVGVGITGVAGPGGGTDDKPVGLVYISVWHKGRNYTRKMKSMNGRDRVRMQAASTALDMIRRNIF